MLAGDKLNTGAIPFPDKAIACVPAPSRIVTEPVRPPAAVGVNVVAMVQVPLLGIGLPLTQLFVCAKSPLAATPEMARSLVPVLVRVTVCPALALPTT